MTDIHLPWLPETQPGNISRTFRLGRVRNYRMADTEKYAHVPIFFNGGLSASTPRTPPPRPFTKWRPTISRRRCRPSTSQTKSCAPEERETDAFIITSPTPTWSHTGISRTIDAVRTLTPLVDHEPCARHRQLPLTADTATANNVDPNHRQPHTAHTTNLVPFISGLLLAWIELRGRRLLEDVAPTLLGCCSRKPPNVRRDLAKSDGT